MKLAIAQMVLGVFILGSLFGFVAWVEPRFYHVQIRPTPTAEPTEPGEPADEPTEGSEVVTHIFFNPGRNIPMRSWQGIYLVLGLAVLGCGIAQFIKAEDAALVAAFRSAMGHKGGDEKQELP